MVSTAQLVASLAAGHADFDGALSMDPNPSPYSTSYPLHDVTVLRAGDARLDLVLKDLDQASMLPEARRSKPGFLYEPGREIGVYRHLLDADRLGTARCYASALSDREGGSWILLERVPGVRLVEIGEREPWLRALRWLSRFHARGADLRAVGGVVPLLHHDERFYRIWMERARAFVRDERLDWIAARYGIVVDRLLAQPRTFIHGELYASNVLVAGARVCPVDWEMAGIGPALVDVAALTAGSGWTDADEQAMLEAYRDDFGEQLFADLDACRVYLAVQWLGWSASWTPPIELAGDWLGVALAATERLRAHR